MTKPCPVGLRGTTEAYGGADVLPIKNSLLRGGLARILLVSCLIASQRLARRGVVLALVRTSCGLVRRAMEVGAARPDELTQARRLTSPHSAHASWPGDAT